MAETEPTEPRLTYSIEEAAKLLGISRNSAFAAAQRGELPSIRIGHRRLVPVKALETFLAKLEGHQPGTGADHGEAR